MFVDVALTQKKMHIILFYFHERYIKYFEFIIILYYIFMNVTDVYFSVNDMTVSFFK